MTQEVEVLSSGVLPAVLTNSGNGEGFAITSGGQSSDLVGIQRLSDVTSGPDDVAVVGRGNGDGVVGIEISPGDGPGGIELSSTIGF